MVDRCSSGAAIHHDPRPPARCRGPWHARTMRLSRDDTGPDADFYRVPRFVTHLGRRRDRGGLRPVRRAGASTGTCWTDVVVGLAPAPETGAAHGAGPQRRGARRQPDGRRAVVHDLNADPALPFADASYDAVLCCVSIDYLVDPVAVLAEVARCCDPGAPVVVTFSNRASRPRPCTRGWPPTTPPVRDGRRPPGRRRGFAPARVERRTPPAATAATRCTPSPRRAHRGPTRNPEPVRNRADSTLRRCATGPIEAPSEQARAAEG